MNRWHPWRTRTARRRLLIGLPLAVLAVVAALWILRPVAAPASVGRLLMVEDTTLVALQGDVRFQPPHAAVFQPIAGAQRIQLGDRVRTGSDGYASILFTDGSTISVDPETELVLRRVEENAAKGAPAVTVEQVRGSTWTRSNLPTATPRPTLEVATSDGRGAWGGQFTTEIEPDGAMFVTAADGSVQAGYGADTVKLPSGFTTRLLPGQPPGAPAAALTPAVTLEFRIEGPGSPLLTDARGRSVGYHPAAAPYVSQIPGAGLARDERGAQAIRVPSPVESYTLTLHGRATEQIVVSVAIVRRDATLAVEAMHQVARIVEGQTLSSVFEWRDGTLHQRRALANAAGPPAASAIAALARQPAPAAAQPSAAEPALPPTEQAGPIEAGEAIATVAPEQGVTESVPAEDEARLAAVTPPEAQPTPAPAAPANPPVGVTDQGSPAPPPAVAPAAAASVLAAPTEIPLTVGVVVHTATPLLTLVPPSPVPPTTVPTTAVPPTAAPTLPPPMATATAEPTRFPTIVRTTAPNLRPAIAPTATPYRPPVTAGPPRPATPTRCPYPSC